MSVLGLLASMVGAAAQPVMLDVDFRLTRLESDEGLGAAAVRLVLGEGQDASRPDTGHRFVTDAQGRARFTLPVQLGRRWISVPVAQTGLSLPRRSDHLRVAAELAQALPQADGRLLTQAWLHQLDIDCLEAGSCSTHDITAAWAPDAQGHFTRPVRYGQTSPQVPELGGLVLSDPAYCCADFQLAPVAGHARRWTLRLVLQRRPVPVRR